MVLTNRKGSSEPQRQHKGGRQGSSTGAGQGDHSGVPSSAAPLPSKPQTLTPAASGISVALGGERTRRGISRFTFEVYLLIVSVLQTLVLVTLNLDNYDNFMHDLNPLALGVVVLFHFRRMIEHNVNTELLRASDVKSPLSSVMSPILQVSMYSFALFAMLYFASQTMLSEQFGKLLHPLWMYLLMWLFCYNWSPIYAKDGSAGASGSSSISRGGAFGRAGGGKRSKGPAGSGAGSRGGGGGAGRRSAAEDRDRAHVASLEGQIVAELWRGLRTILMEALILSYITCIGPYAVRRPSLYIDPHCTATVSSFFMLQTLALLVMNHLHSNWPRYCQWADILGMWEPLSPEYMSRYNIDIKTLHQWVTGNCWARGSIIKFNDRAYMASGKYNAATPGSRCSRILQSVMAMPIQPASFILILQALVPIFQAMSLMGSPYWKLLLVNFVLGYFHIFVGIRMRRYLIFHQGATVAQKPKIG